MVTLDGVVGELPSDEVFVEDLTDDELHLYIGRCENELKALHEELTIRRTSRLREKRVAMLVCGMDFDTVNDTVMREMWTEESELQEAI